MNVQIEESWKQRLQPEFDKDYFRTLTDFVREEYRQYTVYPPGRLIFNAFNLCPFNRVKVVIIGQDPYHGPGQAHGLCFSVNDGISFPPSLVNIFKEIKNDTGAEPPLTGNLTRWAQQGACCCSTPPSRCVPIRQARTRDMDGKRLPTSRHPPARRRERTPGLHPVGEPMPNGKGLSIDRTKHLVLTSAHPSSPFPPTTGSSGTTISAKRTSTLKRTA